MAIPSFKQWLLKENTLVFFFCIAVISGPAIAILFAFDLSQWHDCYSYMGLANFDFDQSAVRRFRVIVPFMAGGLNYLMGGIFNKLAPEYFQGDFGLPFSFFIVNLFLMSYFGLLVYRYCKAYGVGVWMAIIGTLTMLTCRFTSYEAGLPMVDSLFFVVVAMSLLGIKEKNTPMLMTAIFVGPFAKEAYIFIAPIVFFFSHIPKRKAFIYFLLSGALVFTYRYVYELYAPPTPVSGLVADLYHLHDPSALAQLLFNFKAAGKILMNIGLWLFVPLVVFYIDKAFFRKLYNSLDRHTGWFMLSVLVQMFVSGAIDRMFYLAMPVICVIIAMSANELKKLYMSREK